MAGKKIFVSYSHKDKKLFEEFKTMLAPAIRAGEVDLWHDKRLAPGDVWEDEIKGALAEAGIAVLLVSQNFLESRFIAEEELPPVLRGAREGGVKIFWIYLSACLYKQTDIETYQAAHEVSRPLDQLSKPQRQGVLSEICTKLIRIAADKREKPAGEGVVPASPKEGVAERERCWDGCLLLIEALQQGGFAAVTGGPSTVSYRRFQLAVRWHTQCKKLMPRCLEWFPDGGLKNTVVKAETQTLPKLLNWVRSVLPEIGEPWQRHDDDGFKNIKWQASTAERDLRVRLSGAFPEFAEWLESERRWTLLGFRDEADLNDFLYPGVKRVAQNPDPMQRYLFERLVEQPDFSPQELHEEGYRKDIVLDSLNALLREKWAIWLDEVIGDTARGRLTDVGRRLLRQVLHP